MSNNKNKICYNYYPSSTRREMLYCCYLYESVSSYHQSIP